MSHRAVSALASSGHGKALLCAGVDLFDRAICTAAAVKRQAARKRRPCPRRFSVAMAHHNRGSLIHQPLYNLMDHPAVDEVVIVDDGSDDGQFADLQRAIAGFGCADRIKLSRRERNLGALASKAEAVAMASSEWVLLLDSDNTAFRGYLDALASLDPSPETFYCASWAFPFFSFGELEGTRLDFAACCDAVRSGLLRRRYLFNDGNYFVPRDRYVEIAESLRGSGRDGADVMLVNYRWVSDGGALQVLPKTSYLHRLDAKSLYRQTMVESRSRIMDMYARLERGQPCDDGFISELRGGVAGVYAKPRLSA